MAADGPHKLAFVFGPVGWQRENMGRALYDKGGVYRAVFDEVARECRPALPVPLGDVVYPVKGASALDLSGMIDSTFYAQTSLYAVEVALDALYRSHGVAPAACCGHSIGEFSAAASGAAATFAAAADVEGQGNALIAAARDPPSTPPRLEASPARARALTVAEGARLVAARAKRMAEGAAPIAGCMMAVGVGADDCEAAIAKAGLRSSDVCEVGAVNGAGSTVLSGDAHAVARVVVVLREGGAKVRPRRVRGTSHADHSRRLVPIAANLARDVDGILHDKGSTALTMVVSTVTGKTADVATLRSGAHWAAHMTKRVEYVKAARCLARDHGVATFVEIGDGLLGRVTLPIVEPLIPDHRAAWKASLAPAREAVGDGDADFRTFEAALEALVEAGATSGAAYKSPVKKNRASIRAAKPAPKTVPTKAAATAGVDSMAFFNKALAKDDNGKGKGAQRVFSDGEMGDYLDELGKAHAEDLAAKAAAASKVFLAEASTVFLQGTLYGCAMLSVLVEHSGFEDVQLRSGFWAFVSLNACPLAMWAFFCIAGINDRLVLKADVAMEDNERTLGHDPPPPRPLKGRVSALMCIWLAMVMFDYLKKIVYTSYLRGFGVCFGCMGTIGPPKYPNFTRTKHFVLSLASMKVFAYAFERFLGRRRALTLVPPVALALRVCTEAFMLDEHQYGTKVGGLHARYVCDALPYFAWPAFLPVGAATIDATATGDANRAHLDVPVVSKALLAKCRRCFASSRAKAASVVKRGTNPMAAAAVTVQPEAVVIDPVATVHVRSTYAKWFTATVLLLNVVTVAVVNRQWQDTRAELNGAAGLHGPKSTVDKVRAVVFCAANLRCSGNFLGDRFRDFLPLGAGVEHRAKKVAQRLVVCALSELWRGLVFFSATFWCPTRDNVVARLGLRSVFAFMFHPFFVPVAKKVVGKLQSEFPEIDDLAWLPVMVLFQFFVSRQPLLRLDDVAGPLKAWVAAPRGSPRLPELRRKAASLALHPQLVMAYMLLLAAVARVVQVAE